ncbi:MAG: quinolinate synthase NadA [Fimbriimonas ginsengisoli]|uniref:Quinolinate synthase n=1 Tax=Fimbriimonas ginsengisoli TaxID=1005039 RepID=A0A931LQM6_FIMGI|nr:quinolinate synthase NadA [Fimbriimonas ginsengisoli]
MYQAPLPKELAELVPEEADGRIRAARAKLGRRLMILGHHYQRDEIIRHADLRGDSFKLASHAASHPEAEVIVFCGVHFMAESADILTADSQAVVLPNLAAGCSMADMANIIQVRNCWRQLEEALGGVRTLSSIEGSGPIVVPVTYINSAANLKAFVGERGGTVCTSSNAPVAVRWALDKGDKVLFFPDQHLGRNTGVKLGYDPERDMCLWDPFKPLGGNTVERLQEARFLLWKGHCSVHSRFTVAQIADARRRHPGVRVIVHPECELEVVRASDMNGSTETIIREVTAGEPGSVWAVGTEINLVHRLSQENPDKTVFCLDPDVCPCSTMYRIHPSFLCWSLERLVEGEVVNQIVVRDPVRHFAREALDRMLVLA